MDLGPFEKVTDNRTIASRCRLGSRQQVVRSSAVKNDYPFHAITNLYWDGN